MTEVTGPRRRGVRGLGLAVVVLATAACTATEAPPPTVRVDRGIVATTVSASGTLVAITEQNLGFPSGGKLAEVLVKVGDRVEPGQVLARLDDFELAQALTQSRAQLAQQQAALDKIRNGNPVDAARAGLEQATKILDATEEQVEATNNSNRSATERARVQLEFDKESLDRAEDRLHEAREDCDDEESSNSNNSDDTASTEGVADTDTAETTSAAPAPAPSTAACDREDTAESAVHDAERVVLSSETALDSAQERERVDSASGRLSIENARQSVLSAQNELDTAGTDRPADISAQTAVVRDAQAAVALAQRDVDEAALRAPVAGVVSAINGAAGEFIGAASGATALAPGSNARLPGISDAASAGGAGAATGGGAFIVLNDVAAFQLVVPFEESDAARVGPNQQVDVTVDAIPDLTSPGTVLAVAPTGQDASGIVNYNATVVLNETDPRLRDGQTAEASVMVESLDNVLRVPSSTVRTENGGSVVSSPGSEGPVTTPFEAGLVGDEYTEVRSGLTEGQEVLPPQAEVTATTGGPPGAGG